MLTAPLRRLAGVFAVLMLAAACSGGGSTTAPAASRTPASSPTAATTSAPTASATPSIAPSAPPTSSASSAASPTPPTSAAPSGTASASPTTEGTLTIYSGRSQELVEPLFTQFTAATGIQVEVKYGDSAELAATILEEGDNSPADVFFPQDAGALGAVAAEGRFAALPQELLDRVEARFRSTEGLWVGVSGRARVAAYDTRKLKATDLPASVLDFSKPEWKGRVGWVPTNGSFQAFITAFRKLQGDDAAKAWLEGMKANEPKVFDGNSAAVQAIADGEVEVALVNHYYALVAGREAGGDYPVANHFFAGADPGALVNVAGAGILTTADHPAAAQAFVDYLLSTDGQTYFTEETFEYPLVAGVPTDPKLTPLAEIESPEIDLSDLADLKGTLELLETVGIL